MADFSAGLLAATALGLSAPLVLAAMGGLASERSGVMNIALEGKMLTAACVAALASSATANPYLGALLGVLAAVAMSLVHAVLTQAYRIDQIVSGMAINALALGGTRFLDQKFTDTTRGSEIPQLPMEVYFALAAAAPFVLALYLARTRGGLHLLAVGNDPDKCRQMGVEPIAVRYRALIATGVLCGIAGVLLVTNSGRFIDGMTAGKGFIALAALILGGWRPIPVLLACLVFGTFDALQLQLQGTKLLAADLPSEFWNALPYVVTLLALAGLGAKSRSPSGLGKP